MIGKTFAERVAAVQPFIGKRCRITFGQFEPYRETTGVVIGPSLHLTNGNSTGDLIVRATWTHERTTSVNVVSIALARVHNIERA